MKLTVEAEDENLLSGHDQHAEQIRVQTEQAEVRSVETIRASELRYRGKFETRDGVNPVVILLDNKIPKVNGLEVLKIIKTDEHMKTIPIVMLTSSREMPDLTECYKHGVNAYVVKPVDFSEFIKVVKQLDAFWAIVNESPPQTGREETPIPSDEAIFQEKNV